MGTPSEPSCDSGKVLNIQYGHHRESPISLNPPDPRRFHLIQRLMSVQNRDSFVPGAK